MRAGLLLLLSLSLGCRTQGEVDMAAEPVAVEDLADRVTDQLTRARTRYGEGQKQAAAILVREAYTGPFAELEPVLRAHDPQATLELEYNFGQVAAHAEARKAEGVTAEIDALSARVSAAVAALPQPEPVPGAPLPPPAPSGGISTVPADSP